MNDSGLNFSKIIGSIRFKIAAAFSLVFIAIAFITNLLIFQYLQDNLMQTRWDLLYREAESLIADVGIDPLQIPITDEEQLFYIWYESFNGSYPLYEKAGFPETLSQAFEQLVLNEEGVSEFGIQRTLTADSLDAVLVDRPLFNAENGFIRLVLARNNKVLQGQIKSIKENLIWANILSILLSTLLAYIVSGLSLKPVQKVISKARTIEASENMERLPEQSVKDEIGQLSDTMNEMIERIEGSIKNQNRFFAMAAHELRTPLANMQSELEYRLSTHTETLDSDTLTSLREEVIRLKNIVQDFLLMSQLKSDTLELRKSVFRLDDLIYDTLERMRPALNRSNFEVKFSLSEAVDDLSILADREKLEAVLVNLVDNARKYGSNQAPVSISITQIEGSLSLTIQNQINPNPENVQKGMGLGLQIAKRIVQKHGFSFETKKSKEYFTSSITIHQST